MLEVLDVILSIAAFALGIFLAMLCIRHRGHILAVAYVTFWAGLFFYIIMGNWYIWGLPHWLAYVVALGWFTEMVSQWNTFWKRHDERKFNNG